MIKIKVCGMKYPENIEQLKNLGIDYMGFICYPKSSRFVDAEYAAFIKQLDFPKVGVFVNADIAEVTAAVATFGFQHIQLHGAESPSYCAELKVQGLQIFKAFGIDHSFDWQQLQAYEAVVDYFLFDTKSPAHGGTGVSFDWNLLQQYTLDKPFFLSGGLSMDNMQQALAQADPRLIGLDLNSKFESSPALKDITLLENTLKIIRDEQVSS